MRAIWLIRGSITAFSLGAILYSMCYLDLCGPVYPLVNAMAFLTMWNVVTNIRKE